MTAFEIPTLTTKRLRLRAFQARDLDAYAAMQANPEVMRYLVMGRTSTRGEVWRTMLMSMGSWALRGYGMWASPFWHQGFAPEAAAAARDWFFEHFTLSRVASFIRPENHASKRVAERIGAFRERSFELRGAPYEYWVHRNPAEHS